MRIRKLVFSADLGECVVVFDLLSDQIIQIDGLVASVWRELIARSAEGEFDYAANPAEVSDLKKLGLIEP